MESPASPDALMPSSDAVRVISPPLIVTVFPSRPSTHSVISMVPPLTTRSSLAWQPSPDAVMVMELPSMTRLSFDTMPWSAELMIIVPSPRMVRSSLEKITPSTFVSPSASKPVILVNVFTEPSVVVIMTSPAFLTYTAALSDEVTEQPSKINSTVSSSDASIMIDPSSMVSVMVYVPASVIVIEPFSEDVTVVP